jgi:SDR family mycofactocin-dependent oxidoreductase
MRAWIVSVPSPRKRGVSRLPGGSGQASGPLGVAATLTLIVHKNYDNNGIEQVASGSPGGSCRHVEDQGSSPDTTATRLCITFAAQSFDRRQHDRGRRNRDVVMRQGIAGKVAFITGVARGQGRAHAARLAAEGADIIGIDICANIDSVAYPMASPADLEETARIVRGHGRQMVATIADVRDRKALEAAVAEGVAELGRLDFVIANAGICAIYGDSGNTHAAWQDSLDVMLTGALNTIEAAYLTMRDQGDGGSITIVSSMAAFKPMMWEESTHSLGMLGYSAAKAAHINLARNYASMLAPHRIRVNSVHPTGVDTEMTNNEFSRARWELAGQEGGRALTNAIPVTMIQPDNVADLILWLCSDESKFVTGNPILVDAGTNLR